MNTAQNIVDFSHNWNHKLDCDYYTSIRIRNDHKYVVGNIYEIRFKRDKHHEAQLVQAKHMRLDQLNEYIAGIDTGYSLQECRNILLKMYPHVNFQVQEISLLLFKKQRENNADKIAQFCSMYERYTNIKYKISRAEVGMIKNVKIDEKLLNAFFQSNEWWASIKSVTNYVKNYNQIRVLATGNKSEFPNFWSEKEEKKVPTHRLSDYWTHLRSIGWEPEKDKNGNNTGKWIQKKS